MRRLVYPLLLSFAYSAHLVRYRYIWLIHIMQRVSLSCLNYIALNHFLACVFMLNFLYNARTLYQYHNVYTQNDYSEQWALACGEILRILTHYNRPIYKIDHQHSEVDRSSSGSHASTSNSAEGQSRDSPLVQPEKKPLRPLSPWITDILLAAPLGIRSDYFRWWVDLLTYMVLKTTVFSFHIPNILKYFRGCDNAGSDDVCLTVLSLLAIRLRLLLSAFWTMLLYGLVMSFW